MTIDGMQFWSPKMPSDPAHADGIFARNQTGIGVCGNCRHWEQRTNPATMFAGWCPIFSKETLSQSGHQCTAHAVFRKDEQ